jgi:hypothetical protein
MPRTKEKCPHCHADMHFFYRQHVCLECGEVKPEFRWGGSLPTLEEELTEIMEILGVLHHHHFRKVRSTHSMSQRFIPPGSSETRQGFKDRMKERLQEHGELTSKLHFVGRFMNDMRGHLRYTERLRKQLTEAEDALALNDAYARRWMGIE